MSGYEHLKKRLEYYGGNQEQRMQADKLRSLKKALLYSYQAATCQFLDGREFRCLINPNLVKAEADSKYISIPYKDIELTKPFEGKKTLEGVETIGLKCGDVFKWKDTNTYWLVFTERLEEDSYFRAEIRLCEKEITIGENTYHIYWKGETETKIDWREAKHFEWNYPNYTGEFYITKNEETEDFLHRFTIVKIDNKPWEVQAINPEYGDNIIRVHVQEHYQNDIADEREKEKEEEPIIPPEPAEINPTAVKALDIVDFTVNTPVSGGKWHIDKPNFARVISADNTTAKIQILRSKSGQFELSYGVEGGATIFATIQIEGF